MPLFQPAPRHPSDFEASRPLVVPPAAVLEYDEERWYAEVYRGDEVPQLTVRAAVVGSLLGFPLAFTNLYVGLKVGWGVGVAITACILSYALWHLLHKAGIARTPMTVLEANCIQSTASAAGHATGGTMISAFAALLMLSATPDRPGGEHLSWMVLAPWTLFLAALGTVIAIPMKRNMINRERLKFPSGTAAALTLHSLYSEGSDALKKARALLVSGVFAGLFPLLIELRILKERVVDGASGAALTVGRTLLPADSPIFDWLHLPVPGAHQEAGKWVANQPSHWTMVFDHNPVMIAAGALVGLRICISMVVGALALVYVVGPFGYGALWQSPSGDMLRAASQPWNAWKEIGVWFGVPIMVSSGLLWFVLQWKTLLRALGGLRGDSDSSEIVRKTEVPFSWFAWGTVLSGIAVVSLAHVYFEVPWHYGVLALVLAFLLALVACRVTGESDITPVGPMGKLMQLTYGILIPQSATANLMTASMTASSGDAAADLLNDLKSGYLLGANPRRQFMAQFLGIFTGTAATVTGFYLLVPDATVLLGTASAAPRFPAPSAQAWKAVAEVFRTGLASMHPTHQQAILWGLLLGAVMVGVEHLLPRAREVLPSPTGLGLGLILPFQYPLSMLIGAAIAWGWRHKSKASSEAYLVPAAAGLMAGTSIMGVLVAALNNLAWP